MKLTTHRPFSVDVENVWNCTAISPVFLYGMKCETLIERMSVWLNCRFYRRLDRHFYFMKYLLVTLFLHAHRHKAERPVVCKEAAECDKGRSCRKCQLILNHFLVY
jgi:hypothetical protein